MGNIFDKLNHLRELKAKLRQKLEERDVTITDEDTFQEYVDKIDDINTLKKFLEFRGVQNLFTDAKSLTKIPEDVIRSYDLRDITNASYMFQYCSNLTTIPQLDTSNVTDMSDMFSGCSNLTTVPQLDTSNVTDMSGMFSGCSNLTTVPQLDTSNVTDMNYMFYNCYTLTTVPQLDTSNVTDMQNMFQYCSNLTTIPQLDTSNVADMSYMFHGCKRLTTVPQLDTSNVKNMSYMFYNCSNLTTVPQLDTSNVKNMSYMFYGCKSLTDCRLKNIKINLKVGSGTTYGHLLTIDSLLFMIRELVNVNASRTFTIGGVNLSKLSSTYVKLIDITDEMREKDKLIDQKLPFEVCNETDTGAYLVKDYVKLKKWTLA